MGFEAICLAEALVPYISVTTADGAVDGFGHGTTLIDSILMTKPDYNGNLVIILSGSYKGQARDISLDTTGGTVTPTSAFGGKIVAGTKFAIAAIRTTPAEVAAIEDKLDGASGLAAIKAVVDLILVDTETTLEDKLDHADHGLAALKALIDAVEGKLDIPANFMADVSALALEATLGTHDTDIKALLAAAEVKLDKLAGDEYTGTASAGTAGETIIKEITTTARIEIKSIWLDLTNLTADATIKLYHKIDGAAYKVFETDSWAFATDDKGVLITGFTINNDFKITLTGTEGAGVDIPYNIIYEEME